MRCAIMPTYRIHMINEHFEASDEFEAPNEEAAHQAAIKSALEIGIEEVAKGHKLFAAEVRVTHEDAPPKRFIATVGTSPLIE